MRQHPVISAEIIEPLFNPTTSSPACATITSATTATAIPTGWPARDIPLVARAMCVVDAYDAMSYRRPYREPLLYQECLAELERCSRLAVRPGDAGGLPARARASGRPPARRPGRRGAAAARIDPDMHARCVARRRTPAAPSTPPSQQTLRDVRDAHPPTRFLCTAVRDEARFVLSSIPKRTSSTGRPAARRSSATEATRTLSPVPRRHERALRRRVRGLGQRAGPHPGGRRQVVAVVTADVPPEAPPADLQGLRSEVKQSFASLLHSTAERLSQAPRTRSRTTSRASTTTATCTSGWARSWTGPRSATAGLPALPGHRPVQGLQRPLRAQRRRHGPARPWRGIIDQACAGSTWRRATAVRSSSSPSWTPTPTAPLEVAERIRRAVNAARIHPTTPALREHRRGHLPR